MDSDRPTAGLFGKLPTTGDFVARGLPEPFRAAWDGWVTRHLVGRLGTGLPGGLRFRLTSGGRAAAGVILSSHDAVGRRFPLSLVLTAGALPAPPALDPWCDAAVEAAAGHEEADGLWIALDAIPPPEGSAESAPMLLWTRASPALACDPAAPEEALGQLLSSC
ncbi:TagF domain-containing protein [Rhodobacter sp. NSM]|uniref:TagF domain-containing protein n=1 Tax=Rhodobacter sp. NSM TaxID=3457501 RepID=UPI003FD2ECBB